MIHAWIKPIRTGAGVLALLAALACSLLPGGFLPKTAGRCGRELCNCAPEVENPRCESCQWYSPSAPSSGRVLSFETIIQEAEAPGIALQVVFSGVVAPERVQICATVSELELLLPAGDFFALSDVTSDILTPPPRA